MTLEQAIDLLGVELPKEKVKQVWKTLSRWIDEHDESECFPIALFQVTSSTGIVITSRSEEQEHWIPVMCNAMYFSPDQASSPLVTRIDPNSTEH